MDFTLFSITQGTRLLERLAFPVNSVVRSHSPEAVHDLRVAVRRLTQALTVGKACFPSRTVKKVRRRLRTAMTLAGAVRDCDIALKLVARSRAEDAAETEVKLRSRRNGARKVLVASLRQWTSRNFLSKWRQALGAEAPPTGSKLVTAEDVARRKLPGLAVAFFREGRRAASQDASTEQLHELRLAAKKLRYTLELFAEFYGPAADDWVVQLRTAQSLLGGINDCVVTRRLVEEAGGSATMVAALKRRQRRKTSEFRKAWDKDIGSAEAVKTWVHAMRHPPRKPMVQAAAPGRHDLAQHA